MEQWQAPGGSQGTFYAEHGVMPDAIGIGMEGTPRDAKGKFVKGPDGKYIVQDKTTTKHTPTVGKDGKPPPFLRSIAAPANDFWSLPDNQIQYAPGGGVQYYSSRPDQMVKL
jgi:hypothetical protein